MIKNDYRNLECYTYNLSNHTYQYLNTSSTSNMVHIPSNSNPNSNSPGTQALTPEFIPIYMNQISHIASGLHHHCAYSAVHATHFNKNQFLRCWGDNTYHQLDVSEHLIHYLDATNSLYPGTYTWSAENNLMVHKVIDEVSSGPYNVCVTVAHMMVICWGREDYNVNQVPDEIKYDKEKLEKYDGKSENNQQSKFDFRLSISLKNACAIRANNYTAEKQIYCWGHDNKSEDSILNIPADIMSHSYDIAVGLDHVCTLYSIHGLNDFYLNQQSRASAKTSSEPQPASPKPVNFGVRCWGSNLLGQLKVPLEFHAWTDSVVSSEYYSCALNVNYYLGCWGVWTDQAGKFNLPKAVANYTRLVSTGGRHTCMHMGGSVRCIGNNEFGQSDLPVFMENSAYIIETGWDYTCMANFVNPYLKNKYRNIDYDRLEINDNQDENLFKNNELENEESNDYIKYEKLPKKIKNNPSIDTAPNQYHYFSCFGFNYRGQTDFPPSINNFTSSILQVSLGLAHSCTLSKNNVHKSVLACWGGLNEFEQLEVPPQVAHNVALVSVADEHTCAVRNSHSHQWYSSSSNDHSLYYGHDTSNPDSDSYTSSDTSVHSGSAGSGTGSGSEPSAEYEVYCWGSNEIGQTDVPNPIKRNKDVKVLTSGAAHTCTLSQVNYLEPSNQLLLMSQDLRSYRDGINSNENWSADDRLSEIAPLKLNLKFLRDYASSITCWGSNSQGQTSIPSHLIADNVIAGTEHTCILTKGALNCYGGKYRQLSVIYKNIYGEIGINNVLMNHMTLNLPHSPVSNKINLVSMGYEHDCVVYSTGKPYCWGENEYGQSNLEGLLNNQLNVN
eukprot:Mrub_00740.p1 GENE.Mrub_00740~~Mrub_00740.p1  ORF type:complete len:912 (+),score=200.42 Mrub_00740:224-2737(+)